MATETRLDELLRQWEERRRRGETVAVAELCRDAPQLASELTRRIQALEALETFLGPTRDRQAPTAALPAEPFLGGIAGLRSGAEPVPGYRLVQPLGRGGFGEVWKAEAPGGFHVALKCVPLAGRIGDAELRSLKLIRHLRHPNLILAFGAWQRDDLLCIAMELADRTLADRLREAVSQGHAGIPPGELLGYLRDVAAAIDYLNAPRHVPEIEEGRDGLAGLQHRDVKPQNMLLVGSTVKLADFGLARLLEHTVTGHTGSLTPAYAAPEFFDRRTSAHSDQYCLAVSYCELRGGSLPFSGTAAQIMAGHLGQKPDLSMLPEAERLVVAKALAKDPAERWPCCQAFVDALSSAPRAPSTRQWRKNNRSRLSLPALTVGGLVLLVAAALAGWRWLPLPARNGGTLRAAASRHDGGDPGRGAAGIADAKPKAAHQPQESPGRRPGAASLRPSEPEGKSTGRPPLAGATNQRGPVEQAATRPDPAELEPLAFRGPPEGIRCLQYHPNGQWVLTGSDDGSVRLWDARKGTVWKSLVAHDGGVTAIAMDLSGENALTGSQDGTVRVWDMEQHVESGRFEGHGAPVSCVAVSPDGRRAASTGQDGMLRLWEPSSNRELNRLTISPGVWTVAFASDNRHVLFGGADGKIRAWNVDSDQEWEAFDGHQDVVWAVAACPPDGRTALSAGGDRNGRQDYTIRLWDLHTGVEQALFRGHTGAVGCLAVSADGRRVLSGSADGTVRLWDMGTQQELKCFTGHAQVVYSVAISPDGSRAISSGQDATVRLWVLPE